MKTAEEMRDFFRNMPRRRKENPYWYYDERNELIRERESGWVLNRGPITGVLDIVHKFFLRVYESFHSEAQVLIVAQKDKNKLSAIGIPCLAENLMFGMQLCAVMVLPQQNTGGLSQISETFWQTYIVGRNIIPVARIHSHHILGAYQSATDYASLNSGTLEMILGRIDKENPDLCFWLDVPGTDQKAITYRQTEDDNYPVQMAKRKSSKEMIEELKTALFKEGTIEETLDLECPYEDDDTIDNLLDQVFNQMPEKQIGELYRQHCLKEG